MLSTHTSPNQLRAGSSLCLLPPEIIFEISQHLSGHDLRKLAYTCKTYFGIINPVSRASESWKSSESFEGCEARLDKILNNPTFGRYVERLILRPSNNIAKPTPEILKRERQLGQKIRSVLPRLPLLRTFVWDGFETLDESVWTTLRKNCPKIQYLGSSVGALGIDKDSKLFSFSGLLGFQFFSKWQDKPLPSTFDEEIYPLPDAMWDMLQQRCPHLTELEIGGKGSSLNTQLFDVRPLVKARWPALRKLILGNTLMMNRSAPAFEKEKYEMWLAFSSFLIFHSSLETLHLPHCCRFPPIDFPTSLTLKSFRGSFLYFQQYIYPAAHNLEELLLTEEDHGSWYMPWIRPVLRDLPSLKRLAINIDLSFQLEDEPMGSESRETDHMTLFRRLLSDCPRLEHISFICSTDQAHNFTMDELPRALVNKPANLRSIEVLKVENEKEKEMFWTVVDVVRQCPALDSIRLRYTRDSWRCWRPLETRLDGTFSVKRNPQTGNPGSLQAVEIDTQPNGDRRIRQCDYPIPELEDTEESDSMIGNAIFKARKMMLKATIWAMHHGRYRQKVDTVRVGWQNRDDA